MAIFLNFEHVDGLRLRQQLAVATRVEGTELSDGAVVGAKEWLFEKLEPGAHASPDREVPRDLHPKTREPLNTYTGVTINFGLKNLVIDFTKRGVIQVPFRNSSVRNQLRIRYETVTKRKGKDGTETEVWKSSGPAQYLAPQLWGGVAVGDGQRAILDEMPT
jgi:hypothetical protein